MRRERCRVVHVSSKAQPQVFINKECVGGYSELERLEETEHLSRGCGSSKGGIPFSTEPGGRCTAGRRPKKHVGDLYAWVPLVSVDERPGYEQLYGFNITYLANGTALRILAATRVFLVAICLPHTRFSYQVCLQHRKHILWSMGLICFQVPVVPLFF